MNGIERLANNIQPERRLWPAGTVFVAMDECGQVVQALHVGHDRQFREFLGELPAGSPIAVEASGHYYSENGGARHYPQLTNPLRAKQMMGDRKKTDKVGRSGARAVAEKWNVAGRGFHPRSVERSAIASPIQNVPGQ